ncbi:MAG: hypothetical protein R3F19_11655 [Verrucomicrobiales bacterium]
MMIRLIPKVFFDQMSVANDHHRLIYMIAAVTGLRKGEKEKLCWDDLHLDSSAPFLVARASTTKDKKVAEIPINEDLGLMLKAARPENPASGIRVVQIQPKLRWMRRDLDEAGIPYKDERGRQVDLHAMRHRVTPSSLSIASLRKYDKLQCGIATANSRPTSMSTDRSFLPRQP